MVVEFSILRGKKSIKEGGGNMLHINKTAAFIGKLPKKLPFVIVDLNGFFDIFKLVFAAANTFVMGDEIRFLENLIVINFRLL